MNECNFHETHNMYPNLNHQQQFRLNKIYCSYFIAVVKESELMRRRGSKYIAYFDYFDKSLFYQ